MKKIFGMILGLLVLTSIASAGVVYEYKCGQSMNPYQGISSGSFKNPGGAKNVKHFMVDEVYAEWAQPYITCGNDSKGQYVTIASGSLAYITKQNMIPMTQLTRGRMVVDTQYRGKILLFGKQHNVKDIISLSKIALDSGKKTTMLEEGKDLNYQGKQYKYWRVEFATGNVSQFNSPGMDLYIPEYEGASGTVLDSVKISLRHSTQLRCGESIQYPENVAEFKFVC